MTRLLVVVATALVVLSCTAGAAEAANFTTTIVKDGTGTGTVTSVPAGINCGNTCSFTQASGQSLQLTATPDAGSRFVTQSLCGTANPCPIAIDQNRTI